MVATISYTMPWENGIFFAQIMIKFKKDFNVKIILILVSVLFLFNSTVYGIDFPRNTPSDKLRVPVGNSYERMLQAMQQKYKEHEASLDKDIKRLAKNSKSLSEISGLEDEFMAIIKEGGFEDMLKRLNIVFDDTGGRIQVIFVNDISEFPKFEGKTVWGHAGTYITVFVLRDENKTPEGRKKIIGRIFHEIRARSTRAEEIFNERKPHSIEDAEKLRREFESVNIAIEKEIAQRGFIETLKLLQELQGLNFASKVSIMNRDYAGGSGKDEIDGRILEREHKRYQADQLVTEGEAARQQGQYRTARNAWETAILIYNEIGETRFAQSVQKMLGGLEKEAASKRASGGSVPKVFDKISTPENIDRDFTEQEIAGLANIVVSTAKHDIRALLTLGLLEPIEKGNKTYRVPKRVKSHIASIRPHLVKFRGALLRPNAKQLQQTRRIINRILKVNLSKLKLTPTIFLDKDVVSNLSGFEQALKQLKENEGNIPIVVLTEKREEDVRAALKGIDLRGVRFETRESLGLQNFEFNKVMSPILDINNLRCIPLTDSICNTYKALQKARDQV